MKTDCHSIDVVNLFRFMRLFGISLFSVLSTTEGQIKAIVAWPEDCQKGLPGNDDVQEIFWEIPIHYNIKDALELGEFLYDNGWILSDKITIPISELQDKIKWEKERFKESIETLLSIKISMLDDGNETDSFFLHLE